MEEFKTRKINGRPYHPQSHDNNIRPERKHATYSAIESFSSNFPVSQYHDSNHRTDELHNEQANDLIHTSRRRGEQKQTSEQTLHVQGPDHALIWHLFPDNSLTKARRIHLLNCTNNGWTKSEHMDLLVLLPLINSIWMTISVVPLCSSTDCPWPPMYLHKRSPLKRILLSYSELSNLHYFMKDGFYKPENCTAKQKVAIIVPFRDREVQLKLFLLNVLAKAYRQQIEFGVYIIEQHAGNPFNRGALINIGFLQANMDKKYDCFIFHDVDIIPEDGRNYYICGGKPRHIAYVVEQFGYTAGPNEYFGGIVALSYKQFSKINGFSNLYSGWGLEDDDSYRRLLSAGYTVERPEYDVSYCGSIDHPLANKYNDRCDIFIRYARMWPYDGLNSIQYSVLRKQSNQLFKRILVNFDTEVFRKDIQLQMNIIDESFLPPRIPRPRQEKYCRNIKKIYKI